MLGGYGQLGCNCSRKVEPYCFVGALSQRNLGCFGTAILDQESEIEQDRLLAFSFQLLYASMMSLPLLWLNLKPQRKSYKALMWLG